MSNLIHVALFELEDGVDQKFLRWYEGHHVPGVLAGPGWQRMRCYRCTDGQPLLAIYDLDDQLATDSRPSEAPFRGGCFAARGIRNYHARTWREIHAAGSSMERPDFLNAVSVKVEPAHAAEFSRWYNEVHVPEILACPGWRANRRYESVDGAPWFLALYDLEDAERPFNTPDWELAVGWDEHLDHIRAFHGFRVYRLIFEAGSGITWSG